MKVFISHTFSEADVKLAQELKKILDKEGICGYLAETIKKYDKLIRDKIISEIKESDHMVAILTKDSNHSSSVHQELGFALREGIFPIIMQENDANLGVLIFGLESEFFSKDSFPESCKNVLKHIQQKGSRKRTPENIPEIIKHLEEIKSEINKLKTQALVNSSAKPEDDWYKLTVQCNRVSSSGEVIVKNAKEVYSRIQILRENINKLSNSLANAEVSNRPDLIDSLNTKENDLAKSMEKLRIIWVNNT